MDVKILETVHAPHGLGLMSAVCPLPAQDNARGNHPFTVFCSDHIRLRGIHDGHRLEIEYSLPFGFDCFRHLVGFPSTELKFSMQWARLARRNRKGSVFLAFSDMEASSLLPGLLDVHRSSAFCRHPSSVSVTLHGHFKLCSPVAVALHLVSLTCKSCAHLLELGRDCSPCSSEFPRVNTPLWELSRTSCLGGCTPLLHVLPWHTTPVRTTCLRCRPNAILPHTEQLLLILMHEFHLLGFHRTQPFVLSIFMGDAASLVCMFFFSCSSLQPCSRLLLPPDCIFGVDSIMPMCANAFALQPY